MLIPKDGEEITITAYSEAPAQTKTGIIDNGSGGKSVVWKAGNSISLFFNEGENGGDKFTTTTNGPVAKFTGSISAVSGDLSETGGTAYFWGVYPYNASASCDGSAITTTLPSTQLAYQGDVADDLLVTVGRSENLAIYFKNTCAVIGFKLSQDNIKKVVFSGNAGDPVAGEFKVSFDDNNKVVNTPTENAVQSITITPAETSTFETGVTYYFATLPGTFTEGYSLTFTKEDGREATYTRETSYTFKASTFYTMTNKDEGLAFISSVQPNNQIWYTTTDGMPITGYPVAYSYYNNDDNDQESSFVSNTYENGVGIITYEDPIVAVGYRDFPYNFSNLKTISFPSSMTRIWEVCAGCNNLEIVTINGTLTAGSNPFPYSPKVTYAGPNAEIIPNFLVVDDYLVAFSAGCGLEDITIGGAQYTSAGITRLGACFEGNNIIKSVTIKSPISIIGNEAFNGCSNLESVKMNYGVKYILYEAFCYCPQLSSVTLPSSLLSIGERAFSDCFALENITLPSNIQAIYAAAFDMCGIIEIEFPASLRTLGEWAFIDCPLTSVTFLGENPPQMCKFDDDESSDYNNIAPFCNSNSPFTGFPIYVLPQSVDTYKNNLQWAKYANYIQAIP